MTKPIGKFLFHPGFPVDIRHNAKIGREALAAWAEKRLAIEARGAEPFPLLRLIPILGWLYLVLGCIVHFSHPVLRLVWIVDAVLSIGAHGLQLRTAIPKGRAAGYTTLQSFANTMLFGATWWKVVEPLELHARASGRRTSWSF